MIKGLFHIGVPLIHMFIPWTPNSKAKQTEYSRINRRSGTYCVVTLFKAKVISRVNVEYQFSEHSYVTLLKSGIHTMYCIKWKMTILF